MDSGNRDDPRPAMPALGAAVDGHVQCTEAPEPTTIVSSQLASDDWCETRSASTSCQVLTCSIMFMLLVVIVVINSGPPVRKKNARGVYGTTRNEREFTGGKYQEAHTHESQTTTSTD